MLRCFSCASCRSRERDETAVTEEQVALGASFLSGGRRGKKQPTFEELYELREQIGEGKTGQVFVVKHRRQASRTRAKTLAEEHERERQARELEGEQLAAKLVRQEYLSTPNRVEALRAELAILGQVRHPGVLHLREVFQDQEKVVIVTDRALGGEILEAMLRPGPYGEPARVSECDVAAVVRQLLHVLAYLHACGITHRDVKVENILCKTRELSGGIELVDFGLAHVSVVGTAEMSGMNGTPHYMAPEMFHKTGLYGCAVDVWALGVVTFILLFGRFPFDACFLSQVEDKISLGQFDFPPELEPLVSHQAKKFIEYLLVLNPRERPPANLALQHPWLQENTAPTEDFSHKHMTALAAFLEGKKSFAPPPPEPQGSSRNTYVPPPRVPELSPVEES